MAWSHWVVIRLRQWYADLIGLVLRQSKTPETESSQKNVRLNNNALMTTKYSNACMVTQFQCEKCQTGQKLLCNFSISSKHSSGLQFWQLELCRVVASKLSNQIYLRVNLIWSAESGIIQRLLQFGYSLHFCEKSFKKKSQNLGIAVAAICEPWMFLTSQVLVKDFPDFTRYSWALRHLQAIFNYFPLGSFSGPTE